MAIEILDQVFLPTDFAGRSFEANEVTFEAEQKEHVAGYGGRRARPAAILRRNLRCVGEFGKRRSPNLLACAYVDAKDKFSIGVRIGAGAFIEAGSLVTRDVPPRARVLGNPAQVIGEIR